MRIAQVAPLFESVPPKFYGGTERVVSYLTEELVAQGHSVTLYASGDSHTRATLRPMAPRSLRLDPSCVAPLAHHVLMLEHVFAEAGNFDLIHFHVDYLHFAYTRRLPVPHLTTLHGRLDLPDLVPLYREFDDVPLASISDRQRLPLLWANWQGTVYHGLPPGLLPFSPGPGRYLAFLGRISPEKRVDRAIEVARRAGLPLRIAAKVDAADLAYFEQEIEPLLAQPHVEFIGEIGDADKAAFLGGAMALLFLIDWEEPFGLAMIESLACGTPVIAWRHGSVPEVIENGVDGFVVDSLEEAVAAVEAIASIDRAACRQAFERRFTAEAMARNYLRIYRHLQRTPELADSVGN
ncbi:MAG TPA: glycosyltransferase family 4 protein [Aromatoleum sp.]|uniref:glycosyltransferase family 4 protein n=1 Tax=Aromatoleum sp. TaxID=2307007 RepID=UPI002B459AA8|nr:glycosyltransferase family 4 protein [Aromatoleum sp.]HJV25650.1 glycosyltransferase family 4 protein [Aromatoleum sp.]